VINPTACCSRQAASLWRDVCIHSSFAVVPAFQVRVRSEEMGEDRALRFFDGDIPRSSEFLLFAVLAVIL